MPALRKPNPKKKYCPTPGLKLAKTQQNLQLLHLRQAKNYPTQSLPPMTGLPSLEPDADTGQCSKSNTARLSTWAVCANMFTTPAAEQR